MRRGVIGAINGNRMRPYVKGGSIRPIRKMMGMRVANSKCEQAFKNGSLRQGKKGALFRMVKGMDGKMKKVYCSKNLTKRGFNVSNMSTMNSKSSLMNRLHLGPFPSPSKSSSRRSSPQLSRSSSRSSPQLSKSSSRSSSAETTNSLLELANMLNRALNVVPTPTVKSRTPLRMSPKANNNNNVISRLTNMGYKKPTMVASKMRSTGRPAKDFSKISGKLLQSAKKK